MIAEISKETYYDKVLPTLRPRQKQILQCIKRLKECTSKEISLFVDMPLNQFSGRLTELEALGIIEKVKDRNGSYIRRKGCNVYRIKPEQVVKQGQTQLF